MRIVSCLGTMAVVFALLLALPAQAAAVDHITFTTAPQTIPAGEISDVITIQTQDVGGNSILVGETCDLTLFSSSPTGEFSSSPDNWITDNILTWSSNWANRTFYYRDSAVGDFVITAVLAGRAPSESRWETTQNISVTPEPATAILLMFGGLACARSRRTR